MRNNYNSYIIEWCTAVCGGFLLLIGLIDFPPEGEFLDISDSISYMYGEWINFVRILLIPFSPEIIRIPFTIGDPILSDTEVKIIGLSISFLFFPTMRLFRRMIISRDDRIRTLALIVLPNPIMMFVLLPTLAYILPTDFFVISIILIGLSFILSLIILKLHISIWQKVRTRVAEIDRYKNRPMPNHSSEERAEKSADFIYIYLTTPVAALLWFVALSAPSIWLVEGAPIQW